MDFGKNTTACGSSGHEFQQAEATASNSTAATARKRKRQPASTMNGARVRLHCPFPGCNRSFSSGIWRLRVHYRAPEQARGSGVERGHGTNLTVCPRCKTAIPLEATEEQLCSCFYRRMPGGMQAIKSRHLPFSSARANQGNPFATSSASPSTTGPYPLHDCTTDCSPDHHNKHLEKRPWSWAESLDDQQAFSPEPCAADTSKNTDWRSMAFESSYQTSSVPMANPPGSGSPMYPRDGRPPGMQWTSGDLNNEEDHVTRSAGESQPPGEYSNQSAPRCQYNDPQFHDSLGPGRPADSWQQTSGATPSVTVGYGGGGAAATATKAVTAVEKAWFPQAFMWFSCEDE